MYSFPDPYAVIDAILAKKNLREDEVLEKHADWVDEFLTKYETVNEKNLHEIIQKEIGFVFMEVLEDAGVYKCDDAGRAAFDKFVGYVNQ